MLVSARVADRFPEIMPARNRINPAFSAARSAGLSEGDPLSYSLVPHWGGRPPSPARRKRRGKQTVRLSHEGTTAIVKLKAGVDLTERLAGRVAALRAVADGNEQQQAAA